MSPMLPRRPRDGRDMQAREEKRGVDRAGARKTIPLLTTIINPMCCQAIFASWDGGQLAVYVARKTVSSKPAPAARLSESGERIPGRQSNIVFSTSLSCVMNQNRKSCAHLNTHCPAITNR